jgi:hypothetical protein
VPATGLAVLAAAAPSSLAALAPLAMVRAGHGLAASWTTRTAAPSLALGSGQPAPQ